MFSEINKNKVNFTDLKNSETVFGDGMTLDERYPKSFTFAGYSDLDDGSIVVGTTFQEIIDQGVNETFMIEQFPYTVVSNLNANPIRWGFFVNESFKRIFSCMDSVNSYIENTRSSIKTNNEEVNRKFDSVTESIDFVNYSYLESTRHDTETKILQRNVRQCVNKIHSFFIEDVSEENAKAIFTIMDYIPNAESEYKLQDNIIKENNIKDGSITPKKLDYGFSREVDTKADTRHVKAVTNDNQEIQTWVKDYEKNITGLQHAVSHKFLEAMLVGHRLFFDVNYSVTSEGKANDGSTDSLSYTTYIVSEMNTVEKLLEYIEKAEYNTDVYIINKQKEESLTIEPMNNYIKNIRGLSCDTFTINKNENASMPIITIHNADIDTLTINASCDIIIDKSCNIKNIIIASDNIKLTTDISTEISIELKKTIDNSNKLYILAEKATINTKDGSDFMDYYDILYCNNVFINN